MVWMWVAAAQASGVHWVGSEAPSKHQLRRADAVVDATVDEIDLRPELADRLRAQGRLCEATLEEGDWVGLDQATHVVVPAASGEVLGWRVDPERRVLLQVGPPAVLPKGAPAVVVPVAWPDEAPLDAPQAQRAVGPDATMATLSLGDAATEALMASPYTCRVALPSASVAALEATEHDQAVLALQHPDGELFLWQWDRARSTLRRMR